VALVGRLISTIELRRLDVMFRGGHRDNVTARLSTSEEHEEAMLAQRRDARRKALRQRAKSPG
jgi:hypothetical protein